MADGDNRPFLCPEEMVKVKTADLTGRALDYAVATAKGLRLSIQSGEAVNITKGGGFFHHVRFTEFWILCGQLMEEMSISCYQSRDPATGKAFHWVGVCELVAPGRRKGLIADNPMVAICRAAVQSKLGDEVDIPDELID